MKRSPRTRRSVIGIAWMLGAAGLVSVASTASVATAAPATDLFISEYIEGSAVNKAIEIYNGTGADIDLGAAGYTLELYSNGSPTVSQSVALSGVVADGDVFVVSRMDANAAIVAQADQLSPAVINFNGDDGIVLRKAGAIVDAFGQNGVDPGSQWTGGGQNDTLLRNSDVCAGDTNFADAFNVADEWNVLPQDDSSNLGVHTVSCSAGGTTDPVINEFVANHTGSDTDAFLEVLGDASTDYSAYTLLEIEGDSASPTGTIDAALNVGVTNGDGYWIDDEDMENGTLTILLVEGFTGSTGNDIDTNDDGIIDATPWTRIVDDVAVNDGGGSDLTYSTTILEANYDGLPFAPGGASRIPNGTDTDSASDWTRNDFDGFGFVGFPGSPAIGEAENTPGATNVAITVESDPVGVCGDPATFIFDIQGSGLASSDTGNIREIEGVVVGDFQGFGALNGFFVQEEDSQADGNPATSDGIFVFDFANAVPLEVGDVVRVRGSVTEFFGLTEITDVANVIDCGITGTASPAPVTLPVSSQDDFEPFEGMAVDLPQQLFVSGNFTLGRFGEVDLSVGGPLDNPTAVAAPGAAANAVSDTNDLSRIQLDDGSNNQNPTPLPPYFAADGTLRTGDSTTGISAVMSYSFGLYELHPTAEVDFTRDNPRLAPPDVGGSLQVGAYNVLNYFTTLDNGSSGCGPTGALGCRGANNAFEFDQQKAKIVSAISTLDADVLGIMEIENNASDSVTADLVDGINAISGAGTYEYIATGAIGTDAIRVALLYKPDLVTPTGDFAILDSLVDSTFDDGRNRPVLAQTFTENATGAVFTVAVNHLKSKGSNCNSVGDPDMGDEQGNCNLTRTAAALAEVNWLATDPTGSDSDHFLITGDMNAYAMEDPITTVEAAGYVDLVEAFVGTGFADGAYSFNFFAESGYLDHALASADLAAEVTGAGFWHVNSDEPSALDYNNFNQAELYSPDEFRSSDHDPVLVGLDINVAPECSAAVASKASLWPPNGRYHDIDVVGVTDANGDAITITITSIFQDEAVDAPGSGNTAPDGQGVGTPTAEVRAERAGNQNGRVYHISYTASDGSLSCSGEVTVGIGHSKKVAAVDDGALFDSTIDPA